MPTVIANHPVIAAGESLSDAIDVTQPGVSLAQIIFPASWSARSPLTFQASPDGTTYYEVYRATGEPLTVKVVPGGMVVLERDIWRGAWFKFHSGSPFAPVVQQETRTFTCVLG